MIYGTPPLPSLLLARPSHSHAKGQACITNVEKKLHTGSSQLRLAALIVLQLLSQRQLGYLPCGSVRDLLDEDYIIRDPPLCYFALHQVLHTLASK